MPYPECPVAVLQQMGYAHTVCPFRNEATRFNTISKAIPDISPKVLTETLKALETDGLVKRKLYAEIPPRVEYSLTEVGQSLIPILNSLITWALDNSAYISKRRKK